MPSSIRAFVTWNQPAVFSGEDIDCVITFKNIAKTRTAVDQDPKPDNARDGTHAKLERQRTITQTTAWGRPVLGSTPSVRSTRTVSQPNRHRPTLSLSVVPNTSATHGRSASSHSAAPNLSARPSHSHGRSLSIMSLGSDASTSMISRNHPPQGRTTKGRGHGRSASMQMLSRGPSQISPAVGLQLSRQPSPLQEAYTPPLPPSAEGGDYINARANRRRSGVNTAPNTLGLIQPVRRPSRVPSTDFKFPSSSSPPPVIEYEVHSPVLNGDDIRPRRPVSPRTLETANLSAGQGHPINRVLSETSVHDSSPRASSDFYSMSNHSSETIASELPVETNARLLPNHNHSRQTSISPKPIQTAKVEHLMMGYAQTMGYFSVDGSLINQAPFEEVKRKGVMGGQAGGGVVGVERSKRESGLFGAFGWGNIGESLGGLLGMDEMSSMKEMRSLASMKSIPLLNTPQSVLFVDLRLAPGESKSFSYKLRIPKGLPPTHKGRSIKVHYHLKLGLQRPGKQQDVTHVEIPFRVLGSVNINGESLGHDLMSPYVLLHDNAQTLTLSSPKPEGPPKASLDPRTASRGLADFLAYTDELLAQKPGLEPLLSPTTPTERRGSYFDNLPSTTMKQRIDLAILHSTQASDSTTEPAHSSNRFTIARNGSNIATLSILRPAYRLGESIIGTIDFTPPPGSSRTATPTYNVSVALETAEKIDPSLAMRSASSIQRATKKIHASMAETVLFARKTSFNLEIPTTATPTFETTGVRLLWRLRVEFTTARATQASASMPGLGIRDENDRVEGTPRDRELGDEFELLEEMASDERATVLVAKERLSADTFEIAVPIKVYGASGVDLDSTLSEQEGLEI